MPIISLKVTRPPSSAADHRRPEVVKPLFRGSGDTDYQCGNCGSVIAASMGPTQRVIVDAVVAPLAEQKTSSRLPCAHEPEAGSLASQIHDRAALQCQRRTPTPKRPIA